jgi:hypothetical protein
VRRSAARSNWRCSSRPGLGHTAGGRPASHKNSRKIDHAIGGASFEELQDQRERDAGGKPGSGWLGQPLGRPPGAAAGDRPRGSREANAHAGTAPALFADRGLLRAPVVRADSGRRLATAPHGARRRDSIRRCLTDTVHRPVPWSPAYCHHRTEPLTGGHGVPVTPCPPHPPQEPKPGTRGVNRQVCRVPIRRDGRPRPPEFGSNHSWPQGLAFRRAGRSPAPPVAAMFGGGLP